MWLVARGSWLVARGSWLVARGSWLVSSSYEKIVSVIIPAYNAEKYIKSAIESVLSQTFQDFELIIVNDKSTDGTWDIVLSFNDERIVTICRDENSGSPYIPVEQAVNIAKGRFITVMGNDDMLDREFLRTLVERAESCDLDMCCPLMVFCDEQCNPIGGSIPDDKFDFDKIFSGEDACRMTIPQWKLNMNGALIKNEIYKSALQKYSKPGRRELYNDETLSRVLCLECERVAVSPAKYYFRANPNSSTRKFSIKNFDKRISNQDLREIIKEHFGQHSQEANDTELFDLSSWFDMSVAFINTYSRKDNSFDDGINILKQWHDNIDVEAALKSENYGSIMKLHKRIVMKLILMGFLGPVKFYCKLKNIRSKIKKFLKRVK